MSTLDEHSPGNYGLMDVLKVLEFIQRYIRLFRGDPDKVTLVGHGSGASIVGLLMLSEKSYYNCKYHLSVSDIRVHCIRQSMYAYHFQTKNWFTIYVVFNGLEFNDLSKTNHSLSGKHMIVNICSAAHVSCVHACI